MIKINKRTSKKITFLLFFTLFLTGLFTFKDYGISIDEEFHRSSGFYWLNYILNFTSFGDFKNLVSIKINQIHGFTLPLPETYPYYGVVFDLPIAFLEVLFQINDPKNYFYFKHLLNFILFFISSVFFYKLLLNRFINYNIALIGTLFFILSPRIYGNSFFNNKDLVFLSLVTITLYYCFKSLDKLSYKNLLIFSTLAALCTSHRILGFFIPISFFIFFLLSVLSNTKNLKDLPSITFFFIFYVLFLILFWPLLWADPFENFSLAFNYFSAIPLRIKMLFDGSYVGTDLLPYNYIFIWVLITTPLLYVIFFLIGYVQMFKRFFLKFLNVKEKNFYSDLWRGSKEKKDLFILFNITSIIVYFVSFNVNLYTGWRQIYFLNIFIIYISIYAFYRIDLKIKSLSKTKAHFGIIILYLIFVAYKMISYHPYQNIYFNSMFNNNAHKKFEVDYWGLTGRKFLEEILILEKNKKIITIGVASWLPLERSVKLLDKKDRSRIKIIGQEFQNADYLYTNFISEVDKNSNDKYKIPSNFSKINEFILDNMTVYEVFKKDGPIN